MEFEGRKEVELELEEQEEFERRVRFLKNQENVHVVKNMTVRTKAWS